MELTKDLKEFVELLNSAKIDYLIVGAHALAYYGVPRSTGDIDILVRRSPSNAQALVRVMNDFGFASVNLSESDFLGPRQMLQLGIAPNRIDLLTDIDGVTFDDAWIARVDDSIGDIPVHIISKSHLIANKTTVARPQDLADVARLERL